MPPTLPTPRAAAWWIALAVLLVGAAVGGTLWWLLADLAVVAVPAPPGAPPTALPAAFGGTIGARGEMLRTALAAGAGVGAAITLALAFRRQRHQELTTLITSHYAERTAEHTERDATERRVTDLYTKAVEQLGHAKAAVRLGGLYALERLAQDNPGHRQTIVNVICAYLRMPYTPPAPAPDPAQQRQEALRAARRRYQATRGGGTALPAGPPSADINDTDAEGERQVRLTAQRILGDHLRDQRTPQERDSGHPADTRFWDGMRLDLSGATLIDLNLQHCHITNTRFDRTTFIGDAAFGGTTFTGETMFSRASFTGNARFGGTTFTGNAWFTDATFTGNTAFAEATFTGNAAFAEATFIGDAWFVKASFFEDARFNRATFAGKALFGEATFAAGFWSGDGRVLRPGGGQCWPPKWTVVPPEGTELLRQEAEPEPEAPGPGAAGGALAPDAGGGEDRAPGTVG
ncbi:pentapeptide repeat-containing protein [Streptosporangium longisporum]|uniref:Pentapeptide repeat-containing protein n=1 Tax=Streptosporangium longisporum TaxID=46187 RepID=A0ABN3XPU2_9ACTN